MYKINWSLPTHLYNKLIDINRLHTNTKVPIDKLKA